MKMQFPLDRHHLGDRVASLARSCDRCVLVGSWSRNEFHFDTSTHTTYSDVDVNCRGVCRTGVGHLSVEGLQGQIRVSRRTEDYSSTMTLDDSRILAALLLSSHRQLNGPYWHYVRAKVGLLWMRSSTDEGYGETAERVSTDSEAKAALGVKLRGGTLPQRFIDAVCEHMRGMAWGSLAEEAFRAPDARPDIHLLLKDLAMGQVRSISAELVKELCAK
jgi:hypothetical protein